MGRGIIPRACRNKVPSSFVVRNAGSIREDDNQTAIQDVKSQMRIGYGEHVRYAWGIAYFDIKQHT